MKLLPEFNKERCKKCGICVHFCANQALGFEDDGLPYLADPKACTSCRLCSDMCPDWAIQLQEVAMAAVGADKLEQTA